MRLIQIRTLVSCLLPVMVGSSSSFADNTRVTYPNALSIEAGGRALAYSVSFDRVLNEDLLVGVGFGNASSANSGPSTWVVPVYLSYYFMRDAGSLYATVGADLITNSASQGMKSSVGNLQFSSGSPLVGTFGIGYEYRSDAQFLVRLAAYGLVSGNFAPWGGVTFGYSF